MGRCAELQGDREGAVRAYLAVSILYDDEQLVSAALDKAATLLELSGRQSESRATATELVSRYPNTPQGQSWRTRLTKEGVPQKTSLQGVP
jgi:TolA-binding protein